jgi:exosortase
VETWSQEPDYSHGFIVPPVAAVLLWLRRDRFPGLAQGPSWAGLWLITASSAMRVLAAWGNVDALDAWSVPLWLAGVVWLVWGWHVCWWSAPALVFLVFAAPLPFRAEGALSVPLQHIATVLSTYALQCLGAPAISEGNVILLGSHHLEVEQACAGLRIFVGTGALAYACAVVAGRTWWEKLLLLLAAIPAAVLANAMRIVITGILYQSVSTETGRWFAHDVAGWAMSLVAAAMFGLAVLYLRLLARDVAPLDLRSLIQGSATQGV